MVAILITIATVVFKVIRIAAKVAFSRVGAILLSVTVFGGIVVLFVNSLLSEAGWVNGIVDGFVSVSFTLNNMVRDSEWFRTLVYALSLDLAVDSFLTILFWSITLLMSSMVALFVGAFVSFAPMISEVAVAAIRKQYSRLIPDGIL